MMCSPLQNRSGFYSELFNLLQIPAIGCSTHFPVQARLVQLHTKWDDVGLWLSWASIVTRILFRVCKKWLMAQTQAASPKPLTGKAAEVFVIIILRPHF